jgi:hypothetical protein
MGQMSKTYAVTVGTIPKELLPLRPEREVVWIYNVGGTLYWQLGSTVTESLYTGRLQANEAPYPIYKYSGPITAVKASGSTVVYVTECW